MFDPLVGHLSILFPLNCCKMKLCIQSPKSSNQGRQPRHQKVSKDVKSHKNIHPAVLENAILHQKNANSRLGGSSMIRFEKKMLPHGTFNHPLPCTILHHAARLHRWAAVSPDIVLWVETLRRRNPTRPHAWVALA